MVDLYRDALRALRHFWPLVLLVVLLAEAIPLLLGHRASSTGGTAAVFVIYAHSIHRHCLFGELLPLRKPVKTARPIHLVRFMLVSYGMIGAVIGIALILALMLGPGHSKGVSLGPFIIFALIGNLFILSLFGTVLPAAAAGDPLGPAFGLARIRATFWHIFAGLLAGSAVVGTIGLFLLYLAERAASANAGQGAAFAFNFAGTALGLVNTTFAVVVLCCAYRRVVAPDPTPA